MSDNGYYYLIFPPIIVMNSDDDDDDGGRLFAYARRHRPSRPRRCGALFNNYACKHGWLWRGVESKRRTAMGLTGDHIARDKKRGRNVSSPIRRRLPKTWGHGAVCEIHAGPGPVPFPPSAGDAVCDDTSATGL